MKESLSLRFLYRTAAGRACLKVLVSPCISKIAGAYLDSRLSTWLIPLFQKKNNISLKGIAVPKKGFASFNDFFIRKREEVLFDAEDSHFPSPCDGLLSVSKIRDGQALEIKHTRFSLGELLKNERLAEDFRDGLALVFRLTPAHYHRYSYPVDGTVVGNHRINGVLHCVRPIATESFPVFAQNSREYQVIRSDRFGRFIQMEVGAMMVGRITNVPVRIGDKVRRGMEKGYFEFGGSTIIVLLKGEGIELNEKLLARKNAEGEIPVKVGEWVAVKR